MTFGYSWKLSKFFDLPGKISVLALSSFIYFDSLCYLEKKLTCNSPEICSDAMRPELVANYDATNHFIARYGFIHDLRVNSIMTTLFSLNCINTSSQKVNLMLYNKIYFLPTFYTERKKKRSLQKSSGCDAIESRLFRVGGVGGQFHLTRLHILLKILVSFTFQQDLIW